MIVKHTQGPLEHCTKGYPKPDVRAASGRAVAVTWMVCGGKPPKTAEGFQRRQEEDRANARRIVACWNALLPFSTDEIEATATGSGLLTHQQVREVVRDMLDDRQGNNEADVAARWLLNSLCDRLGVSPEGGE